MADIKEVMNGISSGLEKIQDALEVLEHGTEAAEYIGSAQEIRDKEEVKRIRTSYIRYWNRALCVWRLMFIATLLIIIFF